MMVSPLLCASKISADDGLLNFKLTIPFGTAPLPDYIYDIDMGLEPSLSMMDKNSALADETKFGSQDISLQNQNSTLALDSKKTTPEMESGKKAFNFKLPPTPKTKNKARLSVNLNSESSIEENDARELKITHRKSRSGSNLKLKITKSNSL